DEKLVLVFFRVKFERDTVVAPAFSRRSGLIVEDVTVVTAAADAVVFGTRQDQLVIRACGECAGNGREETWPASAAFVFHLRGEDRQITASTDENAGPLFIVQRTRTGPFGAFVSQNLELSSS